MKTRLLVFASVALWVTALGWMAAAPHDRDDNDNNDGRGISATEAARIAQGFDIAPVPLHFDRKDRALVGLGSYLVNAVGGCNDCHTNPPYKFGGDPALGFPKQINTEHYLAGGTAFGPFISRNLTPEDVGTPRHHRFLPEGHTFAEFLEIIRTGKDFDFDPTKPVVPPNLPILQVMPWPVYQSMNDHDLLAIFTYLKAIPPAEPCASVTPEPTPLATPPDPFCAVFSPGP
jgi:hypothetical protein